MYITETRHKEREEDDRIFHRYFTFLRRSFDIVSVSLSKFKIEGDEIEGDDD